MLLGAKGLRTAKVINLQSKMDHFNIIMGLWLWKWSRSVANAMNELACGDVIYRPNNFLELASFDHVLILSVLS